MNKGDWIEIQFHNPTNKTYFYHGKLISSNENFVIIDDIKLGETQLSTSSIIRIRKMNNLEISMTMAKEQTINALINFDKILKEKDKKLKENKKRNLRKIGLIK